MSADKNEIILGATKDGGLVQFNLDDAKGKVADQIRAFLLNMLPASAFDSVIDVAFKKLTEPRPELDFSGNPKRNGNVLPSELEVMVIEEMRTQLKKRVSDWGEHWLTTPEADKARDEMLTSMLNKASASFVQHVSTQIVASVAAAYAQSPTTQCSGCHRVVIRNNNCPDCGQYN